MKSHQMQIALAGMMAGMQKDFLFSLGDFTAPQFIGKTSSKRKRSRYQVRGW